MRHSSKEKTAGLARYKGLILATVLFLILISILMGINAYLAEEVNYNRMRSITATALAPNINTISRDLYRFEIAVKSGAADTQSIIANIQDKKKAVRTRLQALSEGGVLTGPNNVDITVKTFTKKILIDNVNDILPVWQRTETSLNQFLQKANKIALNKETFHTDEIQGLLRQSNEKVSVLDAGIRKSTREILTRSQRVVAIGIALVILYFILFSLYFIRKLRRADETIINMQKESDHIMQTVREGLFLVDDKMKISSQYSTKLEDMIGQRDLGGKSLNETMHKIIPAEEVETTEEFIEALFNERVNEKLIADLNPLSRIKVFTYDLTGTLNARYLDFDFSRVYQKDKIIRVLATVNDVTDAVLLEERKASEREENDQQTEMIMAILNTDQTLLNAFISSTQDSIHIVNLSLKDPGKQYDDFIKKINSISREIHSIKGEASALRLHPFVKLTTAFEDKLAELKVKSELTGNDFLSLTILLEDLIELTQAIEKLIKRIYTLHESDDKVKGDRMMQRYYTNFAKNVAQRNGKQMILNCEGTDNPNIDKKTMAVIKDIIVQLLRNAIVHGLEEPEYRKVKGKTPAGYIRIKITRFDDGGIELNVEDDGQGINFDKIRQKLVDEKLCSMQAAVKMNKRELVSTLFRPGMSTASRVNEDAGRGMGLDVIKNRVDKLGGKINMASAEGKYTRFIISLPGKKEENHV